MAVLLSALFAGMAVATPVHKAVRDDDSGLLRDLLINGDPSLVNATIGRDVTPLHIAAALNRTEAAGILIRQGAKINARNSGGFTPLHWAASRDAWECIDLFLQAGADINAKSAKGITPLHWAANRNATNAVRMLVGLGADLRQMTANGSTPLHWALIQDFSVAAELIADRLVSDEMAAEKTNQPPLLPPEGPVMAATALPADQAPVREIYVQSGKLDSGRALIVNIGLGEILVFEWISPLNLWAGKYEIANGQFRRFRPRHNSLFREGFSLDGHEQPVVNVDWKSATAFCNWLNRTYKDRLPSGYRFRLPLALEWTLLARCGESRKFPWGNGWPPKYGNFADVTARQNLSEWHGVVGYNDGFIVTCPVSKSGMNEWGLYGMSGNVSEWCEDWYTKDRIHKVRRGGSWDFDDRKNLLVDAIGFDRPASKDDTIGFRVIAAKY
jgi:hypothetical protein